MFMNELQWIPTQIWNVHIRNDQILTIQTWDENVLKC